MPADRRPNVVLILADDMGYGDLGVHGNPVVQTPRLDQLFRQSIELTSFYVSPVCAPTRASLMTGRYNYRTGVVDTYRGRALMHPDETTLAEMLSAAGYRTGIFGKWHLGDNAPLRPIDQGFQEALVIKGGGLGQPSDPPGGGHYLDPILQHNGKPERAHGYCSDVFASAAIDFINQAGDRPFFVYLPFNCIHDPLEAPAQDLEIYQKVDLTQAAFPQVGSPIPKNAFQSPSDLAKLYAMTTNLDRNVGRVLDAIDRAGLAESTIVIFLTDNGPAAFRYNAGFRGRKTMVYEGGIRVPCCVLWRGHFQQGRTVDAPAAHIDLAPTILEACGVTPPSSVHCDGQSLLPWLSGKVTSPPSRTLFFQWHRGDAPEAGRNFAVRKGRYKLLRPDYAPGTKPPPLALFDIQQDPFEQEDISTREPKRVRTMYESYLAWFQDVSQPRGYAPIRIHVGDPRENPVVLTPQDWRGETDTNRLERRGYWEIDVKRSGTYTVVLRLHPLDTAATVELSVIGRNTRCQASSSVAPHAETVSFQLQLPEGQAQLEGVVKQAGRRLGIRDATLSWTDQ